MSRHVIATVDEIPPGGRKVVEVAGRSIGVFNLGGELFALRNRCPHRGGPLCEGRLWGALRASVPGQFDYSPSREILACPWHGWEFHVRTGQSWCDPSHLRTRRYEVCVEVAAAERREPSTTDSECEPQAERYQARAEGRYVVVDVPD